MIYFQDATIALTNAIKTSIQPQHIKHFYNENIILNPLKETFEEPFFSIQAHGNQKNIWPIYLIAKLYE